MKVEEEKWKQIPRSENAMVSNLGRIKIDGRIVIPKDDKQGYYRVSIGNGIRDRVHKFVAEAFVPNPFGKEQVNHINANKKDNRAVNLEWVTPRENSLLASKQGLLKCERPCRKILAIRNDLQEVIVYDSQADAERKTGYSSKDINKCLVGQRKTSHGYYWKYLDEVNLQGENKIGYTSYRDASARVRDKFCNIKGHEGEEGLVCFITMLLEKELFGENGSLGV